MENEHQLNACTYWLWLISLCTLPDTARVFCILERLVETVKVAVEFWGPPATLTRFSNELPAP